ncbi:MAG: hypothetical protein JW957_05485 [Candidatus Omnitrophica bacterium]|nr:hypothetical protein [Candidatus Omnitrophota bacterium]
MEFFNKLKVEGQHYPVSPFIHVNFVKAFFKDAGIDVIDRTPEVYDHFGFALMHRNCTPSYSPIGENSGNWQVNEVKKSSGNSEITETAVKTPGGTLRQVYKTTKISAYDYEESPVEYLVKNSDDFELCKKYQPVPEQIDITPVLKAKKVSGECGVTAPWIQGAFNFAAFYFCKIDTLFLWAMTEETFYRELMEYLLRRNMGYIDRILEAGPDLVSYAANIANSKMVSPGFYGRFIMEYEKRLIEYIRAKKTGVIFHNCGYAEKLLPLYAKMKMPAYESLTPPPYGDTVLTDALSIFPEDTVLSGNIDQIYLLRNGTPEEIEKKTREVVNAVRKSGRKNFIVATTDYFSEDTPRENIHAFSRGAKG